MWPISKVRSTLPNETTKQDPNDFDTLPFTLVQPLSRKNILVIVLTFSILIAPAGQRETYPGSHVKALKRRSTADGIDTSTSATTIQSARI
jgi:hypothetical protein